MAPFPLLMWGVVFTACVVLPFFLFLYRHVPRGAKNRDEAMNYTDRRRCCLKLTATRIAPLLALVILLQGVCVCLCVLYMSVLVYVFGYACDYTGD